MEKDAFVTIYCQQWVFKCLESKNISETNYQIASMSVNYC